MRRYRKPKKFKEQSSIEILFLRLKKSQSWKFLRTVVFPFLIVYAIYAFTWGVEERREQILSAAISIQYSAEHLPQFMLSGIEINGLEPSIAEKVKAAADVEFPVSIFHIDKDLIAERLATIKQVAHFDIEPDGGGNLIINAHPATPVAIWKKPASYQLITEAGRSIDTVFHPGEEPDLPLVSGDGADRAAGEIPYLANTSSIISDKIIGFIRVGERRWDVMLDTGLLIMLPSSDPIGALTRVMQWEEEHSITSRRLSRIDMRVPYHPAFRVISEEDALLYRTFHPMAQ